jgi:nitroreductase
MKPVENDIVLKQLNWRYATKKFDASRKISEADWKTLEETLVLAPSSFGLQP